MAKRKIDWDENKLKKWIQEGRGQGEGKDYKPWLTVQDFPSKGRVTRVFGWKTKRIHHFFTDSEARYFYLLEWEDDVLDIREHYPLFNCEEVIQNKTGLNFDLFKDKDTGTPYILSTSFLITLKKPNGKIAYVARSLKADYELERKTALERLEIERRYWQSQNIDWGIVTQKRFQWLRQRTSNGFTHPCILPMKEDLQMKRLTINVMLLLTNWKEVIHRLEISLCSLTGCLIWTQVQGYTYLSA